jgi:hypothetical protein
LNDPAGDERAILKWVLETNYFEENRMDGNC